MNERFIYLLVYKSSFINVQELFFDFASKLDKLKTSKKAVLEKGKYFTSTVEYSKPRTFQSALYLNIVYTKLNKLTVSVLSLQAFPSAPF